MGKQEKSEKGAEIKKLFAKYDKDGGGTISYVEWRYFIAKMTKKGRARSDTLFESELVSTDIHGDNLRTRYHIGSDSIGINVCGFISGAVSRTLTAPAEVVKTEMQLGGKPEKFAEVCQRVWSRGGLRSFYKGNAANVMKVAPQSSFYFYLQDVFMLRLPSSGDPAKAWAHKF